MICLKYSNANSLMGTYLGSLERAQFTAIYSDFSVILVQVPVTYLVLFGELQNLFMSPEILGGGAPISRVDALCTNKSMNSL